MNVRTVPPRKGARKTISRAEYEALIERIEDLEDALRSREIAATARPEDYIPIEITERVLKGAHPIRAWREHRGLGLNELAVKSGVPKGYLSELERGKKRGSTDAMRKLATALGVTLDDLVR